VSGTATLIAGCAIVTFLIKAAGPVAFGGRELPIAFRSVVMVLAPALFAALVATQALADGKHLHVGPETFGVAAGTLVAWRTGSIVGCVVAAAFVTAVLRAV
jgi:branched-subunit amino acid transport protein